LIFERKRFSAAIRGFVSGYRFSDTVTSESDAPLGEVTMHELSIAMSIVEMAEEEAAKHGGVRITAVHLKLGALSGVLKDALISSYEMACENTPLQSARLVIEEVPIMVLCPTCQARRPVSSVQLFCCAECGTPVSEIVQGRELEVVALEIFQENEEWAPNLA
jgi:hydrogenase nickel incorporation protein HypA/HybF